MNHKIYILFLIICLSLNFVCPAYAASEPVVVEIIDASGCVGEVFDVSVRISNSNRACSGSFNICFDNTALEIVDCVKGSVLGNISPININKSGTPGKVQINWMSTTPIDSGEIFILTFKGLKAGNTTVYAESLKFGDINVNRLSAQSVDGNVTVSESDGELEVISISASTDEGAKIVSSQSGLFYDASALKTEDGKVFVASYDGENKLLEVYYPGSYAFDFQLPGGAEYAKIFCWNTFRPLSKAISIDNENVIGGILEDGTNSVTIKIDNASADDYKINVYAAEYDINGTLINTHITPLDVMAHTLTETEVEFDVSGGCDTVRIFVWKEEVTPLIRNIILSR